MDTGTTVVIVFFVGLVVYLKYLGVGLGIRSRN
jgi:hypothetical protein